ncbi:MAG: DegT/DnrJ/EryC1/StrS family aminotransferase [Armatimonadetes bacterium]|nr:MAG: DegT/DnrJ/EryC1/StrS family aminotransferase [Armatimonadota bacterium]
MKDPIRFVDLQAQYEELKAQLDAAVLNVLASGMYAPGEQVRLLEEEIAASCGVKYGVACNSGTDALKIALQAMGIGPGDEVITTPFTFVATVEAIVQNGARPVFVDIDPRTFNMDPSLIEAAITEHTKAILPIHLFGQIAAMESILEIAKAHNLMVLEDAAQAIGSTRNGKACGTWGDAATLSFFPTKNLGAAGDAGMILTNSDEIAERSRSLRVHGMAKQPYYYEDIGHTSRMDEIQGAILRVKYQALSAWNNARNANAQVYDEAFRDSEIVCPYVEPETTYHTYHQYTIRYERRDALMEYLKQHGVPSAVYYPVPLHVQPPYQFLGYKEGDFPETERACREVLSLPIQAHLTTEQVEYCADVALHFVRDRSVAGR